MAEAKGVRIVSVSFRGILLIVVATILFALMLWAGWTERMSYSRRGGPRTAVVLGALGLLGCTYAVLRLVKIKGCFVRGTEDELLLYRPGRSDPRRRIRNNLDQLSIEIEHSKHTVRSGHRLRTPVRVGMVHISFARGSYQKRHGNPAVSISSSMVNTDAKKRFEYWQASVLKR